MLEVTNRCNLRCIHCGSSSGRARPDEMSTDEQVRLVDDLAELGCEMVTLLGGEVLLDPGWPTIARRVRERDMDLVVVTNGLLVDADMAAKLAELTPRVVGVSIDGATRESYRAVRGADGFERAVAALTTLRDAGIRHVTAITSFHRGNLGDFDAFVELFAGGAVSWQVQIAGKAGERFPEDLFLTREDYRWLFDRVMSAWEKRPDLKMTSMDDLGYFPLNETHPSLTSWDGCQGGSSVLGIRSSGDVLPCLSLGDRFVVGNVRRTPLAEIWGDDGLFPWLRNKTNHLTGTCAACDVKDRCRGGCTDMAWSATGAIGENPYCIRAMERERLRLLVAEPPTEDA